MCVRIFKKTLIPISLASLFSSQSLALSTKTLSEECEGNSANQAYCTGFVIGALATSISFTDTHKLKRQFCVPRGVTETQLTKIVAKYIREHPEKLHFTASSIVLSAVSMSFPCSKAN